MECSAWSFLAPAYYSIPKSQTDSVDFSISGPFPCIKSSLRSAGFSHLPLVNPKWGFVSLQTERLGAQRLGRSAPGHNP